MFLFNKKRSIFKILCLVMLSSLTLNLYPFNKVKVNTQEPTPKEIIEKKILGEISLGSNSIITDNEWKELEVDKIIEKWGKYTKTNFDSWGIKNLLINASPESKQMLKLLVENPEAFNIVDEIMGKVKAAEEILMKYFKIDETSELKFALKEFSNIAGAGLLGIFSLITSYLDKFITNIKQLSKDGKLIDKEPAVQSLSARITLHSISSVLKTIFVPIEQIFSLIGGSQTIGDYFIARKEQDKSFGWKNNFINNFKKIFNRDLNPIPAVFKFGQINSEKEKRVRWHEDQDYKKVTLGDAFVSNNISANLLLGNAVNDKINKTITVGNNKLKSILAWAGSIPITLIARLYAYAIPFASTGYSIYNSYSHQKECAKIRQDLIKISELLNSIKQLKNTLNSTDTPALKNIVFFINKKFGYGDIKELFNLLDSPTFKNKDTFWYSRGEVLAADNLLKKVRLKLTPLLQDLANLGGYRAIAQMIKESQTTETKAKFCFVDKVNNNTPIVDLKKAWYPLIDSEKVIPNDINLGNKTAHNAVITGPNGGGKSISMMATTFNILLGQQLGIACSESAKMTIFSKIVTSLHPNQEVDQGLSCFMSEHKRIECVKKSVEECKKYNEKIFVVLDEPYKGTYEAEGEKRAYDLAKMLSEEHQNCSMLMASHFKKTSELAKDTNGLFKNYQMGHIEKNRTTFERTFKIQDGTASWWFENTDNKRTRFVDWLCKNNISF